MTIAVTVSNDDTRPSAVIGVKVAQPISGALEPTLTFNLKAGESRQFFIHQNQSLIVEEISQ